MPDRRPFLLALGAAVRERRGALGLTQLELAGECGLEQTWISHLERGGRNPSYWTLRRLSRGLRCPLADLIRRAEELEQSVSTE